MLSKNPVLKNITAYLIEEASAEEEELLGQNEPTEESDEKDPAVFQVPYSLILAYDETMRGLYENFHLSRLWIGWCSI